MARARLGLTLALLKPDLVARPYAAKEVRNFMESEGFYVVHRENFRLGWSRATQLYQEHKSKFFFERLVNYMTSGEMEAMVLAHPQAIQRWREIMGPTKPSLAQSQAPRSIRAVHGLTDTRNSVHGSGCETSFQKEMKVVFPQFNVQRWYLTQEPLFRIGRVSFSETSLTHIPLVQLPSDFENLSLSC